MAGLTDSELKRTLHGRESDTAAEDRSAHHSYVLPNRSRRVQPNVNNQQHLESPCVPSTARQSRRVFLEFLREAVNPVQNVVARSTTIYAVMHCL